MIETLSPLVEEQNTRTSYLTYEGVREEIHTIAANHKCAQVEEIGRGTDRTPEYPEGRPIEALLISDRRVSRPWKVFTMGHENELTGPSALPVIGRVAARYPELLELFDCNMAIVPASHADGLAMQRWAQGGRQFSYLNLLTGLYRGAATEQVAWGYPFYFNERQYFERPTDEIVALMGLMQRLRPREMHELHSTYVRDAYFFSSNGSPAFLGGLTNAVNAQGFRMQEGPPEEPFMRLHDPRFPGIFVPYSVKENIEVIAGKNPPESVTLTDFGDNAYGYLTAKIHKKTGFFLSEFSYGSSSASHDTSPAGITLGEAVESQFVFADQLVRDTKAWLNDLGPDIAKAGSQADVGRYTRSLQWWISRTEARIEAWKAQGPTSQDTTIIDHRTKFYHDTWRLPRLGFAGQTCSLAAILGRPELAMHVESTIATHLEDIGAPMTPYPPQWAVGAQALASLVALSLSDSR